MRSKTYVTSFDAPILALTGTAEQVAKAAKGYRVYYAKHPEAGGDYSMDHSSVIYVMDPRGTLHRQLHPRERPRADRRKAEETDRVSPSRRDPAFNAVCRQRGRQPVSPFSTVAASTS